jgi:hypothetical protein
MTSEHPKSEDDIPEVDFIRASGDVICEVCGKPYRKHPFDMEIIGWQDEPFLNVLCDGTRVKL